MNEQEYVADFAEANVDNGLKIKKYLLSYFLKLVKYKLEESKFTNEQMRTFLGSADVKRIMLACVIGLFNYCQEFSKGGRITVLHEWYLDDLEDQGLYFLIKKYQLTQHLSVTNGD